MVAKPSPITSGPAILHERAVRPEQTIRAPAGQEQLAAIGIDALDVPQAKAGIDHRDKQRVAVLPDAKCG